ncbi:hypothetical protein BESB_059650 [Besnoitia besnoiti]|uniref:Uncharacterized protein n=1 Tax=Besnoitia besnoiti TaxID=94643 RepID=A0A2A9M9C2_BESBE|nr:hypothetical protein BESB_059650 [Besnoitia besnoiti]PFH35078.1 hypothetical protein BESB_059650 [Besnoitia besnoiti]
MKEKARRQQESSGNRPEVRERKERLSQRVLQIVKAGKQQKTEMPYEGVLPLCRSDEDEMERRGRRTRLATRTAGTRAPTTKMKWAQGQKMANSSSRNGSYSRRRRGPVGEPHASTKREESDERSGGGAAGCDGATPHASKLPRQVKLSCEGCQEAKKKRGSEERKRTEERKRELSR